MKSPWNICEGFSSVLSSFKSLADYLLTWTRLQHAVRRVTYRGPECFINEQCVMTKHYHVPYTGSIKGSWARETALQVGLLLLSVMTWVWFQDSPAERRKPIPLRFPLTSPMDHGACTPSLQINKYCFRRKRLFKIEKCSFQFPLKV